MTYIILSIIFCVFLAFLSVSWQKKPAMRKKLLAVNASLSAVGAVGIPLIYFLSMADAKSVSADDSCWALDTLTAYYTELTPIFLIMLTVFVLSSVSVLFDKKQRSGFPLALRSLFSVFAPSLILILGGFWGATAPAEHISLEFYIYATTYCEAALFRSVYILEYIGASSTNVKKQ